MIMIHKKVRIKHSFIMILLVLFFIETGNAETIEVQPGTDTLSSAIDSAQSGDTLILLDGDYDGNTTVNKSLTIRARSKNVEANINNSFSISGQDIDVVVQGLVFSTDLVAVTASSIKILENKFLNTYNINVTGYKTSEGDGSLWIIGNYINCGHIEQIWSENAIIAGNTLKRGCITAYTSASIIGNYIWSDGYASAQYAIVAYGSSQIIGNRIERHNNYISNNVYYGSAIRTAGLHLTISGNLIVVHDWGGSPENVQAIFNNSKTNNIINNTIIIKKETELYSNVAIRLQASSSSTISNSNIFVGGKEYVYKASTTAVLYDSNNICYAMDTDDCAGFQEDPNFIDEVDYKPSPTSIAINNGDPDNKYIDLDLTRNDIGAYGGPWNIEQFDIQRTPGRILPFVYPLFEANTGINEGDLEVRAIGVARLR